MSVNKVILVGNLGADPELRGQIAPPARKDAKAEHLSQISTLRRAKPSRVKKRQNGIALSHGEEQQRTAPSICTRDRKSILMASCKRASGKTAMVMTGTQQRLLSST